MCQKNHSTRERIRHNLSLHIVLLFFFLLLFTAGGVAGEVKVSIRFDSPTLLEDENGYTTVVFPRTIQAGRPGEPSFPFRAVHILLPPGEKLAKVRIKKKGELTVGSGYTLYPVQYVNPGMDMPEKEKPFIIDRSVYSQTEWISPPYGFKTGYLRGHSIALGAVSPVTYRPADGVLGFYREIEITCETVPSQEAARALELLRTDPLTERRVRAIVENDGLTESYSSLLETSPSSTDFEYLIITTAELVPFFEPLGEFYTRRGIRTTILTTEHIDTTFSGTDTAERMRNAIIDNYVSHHIDYVLLAGDSDGPPGSQSGVPDRGLYCGVQSSSFYEDANIPADIYFAALDGNWNTDGDALWGEQGEEDFYSEVAVGRACVDDSAEAASLINKIVSYQSSPVVQDVRKAALFGEKLWSDPLTYGGDEMDQLIGTCTAYGFTTSGIPEDFDITKYYDRELGSWDRTAVFGTINAGTNWLVHAGHSNWQYVIRLYLSDVTDENFTNDGAGSNFPIIYSYGCYAASFDNRTTNSGDYLTSDCIAEEFLTIHHGAAAFLGNSRYGWFTEGTTNGPSHHIQREFYDAIFTEGFTHLGDANQRSKDETVPFIDLPDEYEPGAQRWCFYTLNLLGDPAMDGWTDTPSNINVNHPPEIERTDTTFYIETDAPLARASLYMDGTCYGIGTADTTGRVVMKIFAPLPDTLSSVELVVTAHNRFEYSDTLSVVESTGTPLPSMPLVLRQNVPNPFNPLTTIGFELKKAGHVTLIVYDISGREVERLLDSRLEPGSYSIRWRPRNLSSGVYFYTLETAGGKVSRKAILLR